MILKTLEPLAISKKCLVPSRFLKNLKLLSIYKNYQDLDLNFIPFSNKAGNEGIILYDLEGETYAIAYELGPKVQDTITGRTKPITCDICMTWRQGGTGRVIVFPISRKHDSISLLICGDLACSLNARGLTDAYIKSKVHINESLSNDQRVLRLQIKLKKLHNIAMRNTANQSNTSAV